MKQILLLNILCLMSLCLSAQTYQTKRDISYSSKTDAYAKERLKLDVYYPEGLHDCPPLVLICGDSFSFITVAMMPTYTIVSNETENHNSY